MFAGEDWSGDEIGLRDLARLSTLCYVWAPAEVPREHFYPSPYRDNVVTVAVRTGDRDVGRWVSGHRDLRADFLRAFGRAADRETLVFVTGFLEILRQRVDAR